MAYAPDNANSAMLAAGKNKHSFTYLTPPENLGHITAADVAAATSVEHHIELVKQWANCCWQAWQQHHAIVRSWLPEQYKNCKP